MFEGVAFSCCSSPLKCDLNELSNISASTSHPCGIDAAFYFVSLHPRRCRFDANEGDGPSFYGRFVPCPHSSMELYLVILSY